MAEKGDKKEVDIDKFFQKLAASGGLTVDEGIIYMWNDPDIYFTADAMGTLYQALIQRMDKKANDLFYWIGHLYGKSSSEVLVRRFGF